MVASTGHKEHESEVFGALASHLSAEGAGLAGGPSLGAPKAKARRFHVVARSLVLDLSQISALEFCHRSSQQNTHIEDMTIEICLLLSCTGRCRA